MGEEEEKAKRGEEKRSQVGKSHASWEAKERKEGRKEEGDASVLQKKIKVQVRGGDFEQVLTLWRKKRPAARAR